MAYGPRLDQLKKEMESAHGRIHDVAMAPKPGSNRPASTEELAEALSEFVRVLLIYLDEQAK